MSLREDWAWATGLFDGEGCVNVHGTHVTLAMHLTDFDLIERFRAIVGVGTVQVRKVPPGHKTARTWLAGKGEDVQAVLTGMRPWLGKRRSIKAQEALDAIARRKPIHTETHCIRGHPRNEANVYRYTYANGEKFSLCRLCSNELRRAARRARKAA